jgi:hypothetical protein
MLLFGAKDHPLKIVVVMLLDRPKIFYQEFKKKNHSHITVTKR